MNYLSIYLKTNWVPAEGQNYYIMSAISSFDHWLNDEEYNEQLEPLIKLQNKRELTVKSIPFLNFYKLLFTKYDFYQVTNENETPHLHID